MTMKAAFSKQANFIKVMDYLQYSLVWFDTTSNREVYFNQVQPYNLIYVMHKPHQSICIFVLKRNKKTERSQELACRDFRRVGGYK